MKKLLAFLAIASLGLDSPADAGGCAALRQRVVRQKQVACVQCVQQVQVQKIQKVQQIIQQKQVVQEIVQQKQVVVPVKQVLEVVEPIVAVQYVQYPVLSYSAGYARESLQAEADVAELKRDMAELKQMLRSLTLPQRQNGNGEKQEWKDKQELKSPQPK